MQKKIALEFDGKNLTYLTDLRTFSKIKNNWQVELIF